MLIFESLLSFQLLGQSVQYPANAVIFGMYDGYYVAPDEVGVNFLHSLVACIRSYLNVSYRFDQSSYGYVYFSL